MNARDDKDAASVRLYQSFERFQQFDDNHVDFGDKLAKLGSAAAKRTGPKSGQWNVAVHVPLVNKSVKPKKVAPKQEVKRWKGSGINSGDMADSRGSAGRRETAEPVVKSRAPAAQVINIQDKLAHRYTAPLPPEMTMKEAQVRACATRKPVLPRIPMLARFAQEVLTTMSVYFLSFLFKSRQWHTWASKPLPTIHCV